MTPDLVGGLESPDYASHDRAAHGPYTPVFVGDKKRELDELLTRYPTKMAALLPALWMVQHERGWVSDDGIAEVAQILELTPAYLSLLNSQHTEARSENISSRCAPHLPVASAARKMW